MGNTSASQVTDDVSDSDICVSIPLDLDICDVYLPFSELNGVFFLGYSSVIFRRQHSYTP